MKSMRVGQILVVTILIVFSLNRCNESPHAPENTLEVADLGLSSNGIYTDTVGSNIPFVDIPVAYRDFFMYCAPCHSNLGVGTLAVTAKQKLALNTWSDITQFGATRLVVAAKFNAIPRHPSVTVPTEILSQAEAFLASWSAGISPALMDCQFGQARDFVTRYCSDCHTLGGKHPDQKRAYRALKLDRYAVWQRYQPVIAGRLLPDHPGGDLMPPKTFSKKPSDAERQILLQWLGNLSPNTQHGDGQGDSLRNNWLKREGAVSDLVYTSAREIINNSCADCHARNGVHKDQAIAWGNAIQLDTYAQWERHQEKILERLDVKFAKAHTPPLDPMPKYGYPFPLSDSDRQLLIDWIERGSPNTPDGK